MKRRAGLIVNKSVRAIALAWHFDDKQNTCLARPRMGTRFDTACVISVLSARG